MICLPSVVAREDLEISEGLHVDTGWRSWQDLLSRESSGGKGEAAFLSAIVLAWLIRTRGGMQDL